MEVGGLGRDIVIYEILGQIMRTVGTGEYKSDGLTQGCSLRQRDAQEAASLTSFSVILGTSHCLDPLHGGPTLIL